MASARPSSTPRTVNNPPTLCACSAALLHASPAARTTSEVSHGSSPACIAKARTACRASGTAEGALGNVASKCIICEFSSIEYPQHAAPNRDSCDSMADCDERRKIDAVKVSELPVVVGSKCDQVRTFAGLA